MLVLKGALPVLEASAPVTIIDACIDDLIAAISLSLVLVIDLSVVLAPALHCGFIHLVSNDASTQLFLRRCVSRSHSVVVFLVPISLFVDVPVLKGLELLVVVGRGFFHY